MCKASLYRDLASFRNILREVSLNCATVLRIFLKMSKPTFISAATTCTPITGKSRLLSRILTSLCSYFFSQWQQVWVRWDLREASICISQTTKDVEYFLKYLLATCISSRKSQLLIGLCINWMIWGLGVQLLKYL